jgi:hypothetical protein
VLVYPSVMSSQDRSKELLQFDRIQSIADFAYGGPRGLALLKHALLTAEFMPQAEELSLRLRLIIFEWQGQDSASMYLPAEVGYRRTGYPR